jgi:hypothetical protein
MVGVAVALVLGGAPAGASAVTFGTNLEQPANAPIRCGEGVLNQFTLTFMFGPFGSTCMWSSVVPGSVAESLTAPATGTVTAVHVRM